MKSEEFEKIWNEEKNGKDILDRVFEILRQSDLNIYDCELEVTHAKKIKYMTKTFKRIQLDGTEQEVLERFKLYFNKNNDIFYIRYTPTVTYGYKPIMSLEEFFKAMYKKKNARLRDCLETFINSCVLSITTAGGEHYPNIICEKAYYNQYNQLCFDLVGGFHIPGYNHWTKYFEALSSINGMIKIRNASRYTRYMVDKMEYNPLDDEFCCTYIVEGFGDEE